MKTVGFETVFACRKKTNFLCKTYFVSYAIPYVHFPNGVLEPIGLRNFEWVGNVLQGFFIQKFDCLLPYKYTRFSNCGTRMRKTRFRM